VSKSHNEEEQKQSLLRLSENRRRLRYKDGSSKAMLGGKGQDKKSQGATVQNECIIQNQYIKSYIEPVHIRNKKPGKESSLVADDII
jgi:hypothetical protein